MRGYIVQIEEATRDNQHYRRVLFTAEHSQLVLMNLKPGEEIGEEVHELDQFIRFEEGEGTVILDGGTDNKECDGVLAGISALRQSCGKPIPCVILLSTRGLDGSTGMLNALIDQVVAKPITPERLQPVVDELIERCARS